MSVRKVLLLAIAALGALALGAGSAQAGTGLGPLFSFGLPEGVGGPAGVAVDQSNGDVIRIRQWQCDGEVQSHGR